MYRVVIVDDEAVIRSGLRELISWDELGMEIVWEAGDGAKALEYIRGHEVNILITDIQMEGMDGLSLIERAKEECRQLHCVILTGYDYFSYMKRAIQLGIDNYILKPIDEKELVETLLSIEEKLHQERQGESTYTLEKQVILQSVLGRWLNGTIELFALRHRAEFLKIPLDAAYVQACVLRAPQWQKETNGAVVAKQRERLAKAFIDFGMGIENVWVRACWEIKRELVLVFCGELKSKEAEIKKQLGEFIRGIQSRQHILLFAAFGSLQKDAKSLSVSYEDARKTAELNLILPEKTVIEYREPVSEEGDRDIPELDYEKLEEAILGSDPKKISQMYRNWTQLLLKSFLNPALVKNYAMEKLCRLIVLRSDSVEKQGDLISDQGVLEDLLKTQTFEQMSGVLENYSLELAEQVRQKQETVHPSVRRLIAAVEKDYSKELTLRGLADKFNANPVYLGRLFKEETGQTFTMYLNQVRMREAKKLLAGTDMTVAEIAAAIGYASAGYFTNQFKKMFSCFPREYRMKQQ